VHVFSDFFGSGIRPSMATNSGGGFQGLEFQFYLAFFCSFGGDLYIEVIVYALGLAVGV
jgi:hypothetical protein